MWLSFGGVKSQNEFAAAELSNNKLHAMVTNNFGKAKFSWKMQDMGSFRAQNCSGVLAGANFIACGAAARLGAGAAAAPE